MLTKLNELRKQIETGSRKANKVQFWGGAGLIVSNDPERMHHPGDICVITKHAAEVSALIYELRDIFDGEVDHLSKYSFYGRIGEAAKGAVSSSGDDFSAIAQAMLAEAMAIANEQRLLYFAYGSNMDGRQMQERCPDAALIGKAYARGYAFALDSEGVATLTPDANSTAEGVLWSATRRDIESLDEYEGVELGCYSREMLTVRSDGEDVQAIVYISSRGAWDGSSRPDYLNRVIAAARENALSDEYIATIEQWRAKQV